MNCIKLALAFAGVLAMGTWAQAQIWIDNGIVGDGYWRVQARDGGDSYWSQIDPVGDDLTSVLWEYHHTVDAWPDEGGVHLGNPFWDPKMNITSPAALTGPNEVTSTGWYSGPNGPEVVQFGAAVRKIAMKAWQSSLPGTTGTQCHQ